MKKYLIFTIYLAFAMFCTAQVPCWDGTVAESYAGGNGTMENPYQIATPQQLALLANQTNEGTGGNAYYMLTNDIDLSNCSGGNNTWVSIGQTIVTEIDTTFRYFTGHFDGNGKTVSNLYQHQEEFFKGLFGCTDGAEIKNVNLVSVDIDGDSEYGGALVAYAGVTDILNCNVSESDIKTTTGVAGGIVGFAGVPFGMEGRYEEPSKILSCRIYNVDVEGVDYAGGIVGRVSAYGENGVHYVVDYARYTITDCSNDAGCHVQGVTRTGGITGYVNYGIIEDCVNNCNVAGNNFVGGICGVGWLDVSINNCVNNESGVFAANNCGGGIIGSCNWVELTGCRNKSTGSAYKCGGIAGFTGNSNIKNCVNEGSFVNVSNICGGIIGEMGGEVMADCVNYGNISGTGMIGGLVGELEHCYICGSANKGNISGIMSNNLYVGGLVGASLGKIANSYNTGGVGVVNADNRNYQFGVGGIVGVLANGGYIYNVYNSGAVTNPDNAQSALPDYGNIVGYGYYSTGNNYRNCYWLDDDDLPANGNQNAPDLPGSTAFNHGSTSTSWMLNETQYDTYNMIEALNLGSEVVSNTFEYHHMPFISVWAEDVNGENNGYPVVASFPKYPLLGSEWYYGITDVNGNSSYQYLAEAGDTVISHKKVKIIVKTNTLYDKDSESSREYIFEDNGCVYWWHNPTQDSTILYDFTANVGDEWTINVENNSITMHVDEVGLVEYNGQTFKSLTISDENDIFSGTIVCSVGHVTSFFPERLLEKKGNYDVDGIRCYWEGPNIIYQEGDVDCDSIYEQIHVGLEETTADDGFEIYPNPSHGTIFIRANASFHDIADYCIIDILGETVMSGRITSEIQEINISNLPNGMYLVKISDITVKIIIDK